VSGFDDATDRFRKPRTAGIGPPGDGRVSPKLPLNVRDVRRSPATAAAATPASRPSRLMGWTPQRGS